MVYLLIHRVNIIFEVGSADLYFKRNFRRWLNITGQWGHNVITFFFGGGGSSYLFFFFYRCRHCKKYTFPLWDLIKRKPHVYLGYLSVRYFVYLGEISWRLQKEWSQLSSDGQLECTFQNIRVPTCKYLFDN